MIILIGLVQCTNSAPAVNVWYVTKAMSTGRYCHTSTFIPELNSAMIIGGSNGTSTLSLAEKFSLSDLSFIAQQQHMTQRRACHTADRLNTNAILLAGGSVDSSAEIYDPLLGITTRVVNMIMTRSLHTSSIINNGNTKYVLLAGGYSGPDPQRLSSSSSADIYNSVTGMFTSVTNAMSSTRNYHTATVIPNNYVIIAGGFRDANDALDSLELYNISSNMFIHLSSHMSVRRGGHTATYIPSIQAILFVGGKDNNTTYGTYDLFDISTLTIVESGMSLNPRTGGTATLLRNNQVLFVGGHDGYRFTSSCELYDPLTNTFKPAANLSIARAYHTATLLENSNQVLVCGGFGNDLGITDSILKRCELYSP